MDETKFIAQGRIVWGHPAKPQKKTDPRTKQVKLNDQGQPIEQWVFGLAVEKNEFNANVWPYMYAEAAKAFPNGTPNNFSWKFKDGDTDVDANGNPYSGYEGRAGCMIMTISTELKAPPLYKMENGQYVQIDGDQVKCGDYVAVSINCKFNGATGVNTPGLYVNPEGIIHIGYGTEIITSGFDVDEAFAGFTPQLPPGASPTPLVQQSAPLPQGMQQTPPAPVQQQAVVPAAPQPMQQTPPPAHDYVANAIGQQPVQPATQPAAPQPMQQPQAVQQQTPPVPVQPPAPAAPVQQQAVVPGQPPAMPGVPPAGSQ